MVPLRWATASTIIGETTMNDTNLQLPAQPGEVLREWITGNAKTIAQTADLLGASTSQLNRVLAGKVRLSATLAVRLERLGWSTTPHEARPAVGLGRRRSSTATSTAFVRSAFVRLRRAAQLAQAQDHAEDDPRPPLPAHCSLDKQQFSFWHFDEVPD